MPGIASSSLSGNDEIVVSFDVFAKLLKGKFRLALSRLKPFPAQAALAFLFHMNELGGGLNHPSIAYRALLGNSLKMFARKKVDHARSAKKDHLSFRPQKPGPALMELIYRVVKAEDRCASIINGNLMAEVRNLDALIAISESALLPPDLTCVMSLT
jgi:hypothetical protein